ncbi:hypothetical protein C2G38_84452 [Gigaspora rosea]|uniref:Uncharacterized protein n=1 Tax=Gigaspora rosea TaxID=44941 RepID=A0A397VZ68_9GLOM|nr:hypothetical protein C2G38_84452 [Gigaspora rosea]
MRRQRQEIYEATRKKPHKTTLTKRARPPTGELPKEKRTRPPEWRNVQDHLPKKHTELTQ